MSKGKKEPIVIIFFIVVILMIGILLYGISQKKIDNLKTEQQSSEFQNLDNPREQEEQEESDEEEAIEVVIIDIEVALNEEETVSDLQENYTFSDELMEEQKENVKRLNRQNAGLSQRQQCLNLLKQMPNEDTTWLTGTYSKNYNENLILYWNEILDAEKIAKEGKVNDAKGLVKNAKELTKPYYDNFVVTCENLYDFDLGILNEDQS